MTEPMKPAQYAQARLRHYVTRLDHGMKEFFQINREVQKEATEKGETVESSMAYCVWMAALFLK